MYICSFFNEASVRRTKGFSLGKHLILSRTISKSQLDDKLTLNTMLTNQRKLTKRILIELTRSDNWTVFVDSTNHFFRLQCIYDGRKCRDEGSTSSLHQGRFILPCTLVNVLLDLSWCLLQYSSLERNMLPIFEADI